MRKHIDTLDFCWESLPDLESDVMYAIENADIGQEIDGADPFDGYFEIVITYVKDEEDEAD